MERTPSQKEARTLVALFAEGRYPEAAILAERMSMRFPLHALGWKVLGVALKQSGRSGEALEPLRKTVALTPADADAHMNLAVTLQELGRLFESEASFGHALGLNPEFAEAHYCLGNTLRDLGRMEEAETCYRRALQARPGFVEAHGNLGALLQQAGRLEEAEASYRRVLHHTPDCAESHYNLGNTVRDLGRLEEAEACYRRALRNRPEFAEAHSNLGFVLQALGRPDEAETVCRKAIEIAPDQTYTHFNLGKMLQDMGRFKEAEASYRQALEIKPDFADAYNNLGAIFKAQGLPDEAVSSYQKALEIKPDYADAHCNLAAILNESGRLAEALAHYRKALAVCPSLLTARLGISGALSRIVPHWHVPMMNDRRRNSAYFAALESAITADTEVLEVGTGSGLLAMMAARFGAKRVTTCEAVPLIAETARRIIAENGFEHAIQVITKQSTDVQVGQDLFQRADVLVAEIFSSELLGEHVLPSIEDAKHRLLKPRGRVIPSAGSIMVALIGDGDLARNVIVEDSFGFKLQRFNSIISEKQVIARNDLEVALLSEDIEAFRFDFQNDGYSPSQTKTLRIPVRTAGRCHGLIQWIRLQLDEAVSFENHPSQASPVSNWQHCTYVFAEPIDVNPGEVVLVSASHNRVVPWFSLGGIETA